MNDAAVSFDVIVHIANVSALAGGAWAVIKVLVPTGLSIRDSLRDTASSLSNLKDTTKDHETRLRDVERYVGPERRKNPREES